MDLNELLYRYQIELMEAGKIGDCRKRQDRIDRAHVFARRASAFRAEMGAHLPLTLVCVSAIDVVMPECV